MKLKISQNDKVTKPEESLTLKPFDKPKFQETPLKKPDSKTKSELESKHPKDVDEYAKDNRDKTKRDAKTPIDKISADKNTHHKPISEPNLNQEDAMTKRDNLVVETKPGKTSYLQ